MMSEDLRQSPADELPQPFDGVQVSVAVADALGLAARRRRVRPVSTLDVLLALIDSDALGGWEGVQVRASFVTAADAERIPDPAPDVAGVWEGAPLTRTATEALRRSTAIAARAEMTPVPAGVLALALLADAASSASRALLEESESGHRELLDDVEGEILGTRLDGLDLGTVPPVDEAIRGRALGGRERGARRSHRPSGDPVGDAARDAGGALSFLAALVERAGDPLLRDLLRSMLLDGGRLRDLDARLGAVSDVPASRVVATCAQRFDGAPDVASAIAAALLCGSARVETALAVLAISSREAAAQVLDWRAGAAGRPEHGVGAGGPALGVGNSLLAFVVSVLVVMELIADGGWWRLPLLIPVWWGYPTEGPGVNLCVAALLAAVVGPVAGLVQVVRVPPELLVANRGREARLSRTGVPLSRREDLRVAMRAAGAGGRRVRRGRQGLLMRWRARRPQSGMRA